MHAAKLSLGIEAQMQPARRNRAETRYMGRLPQSLAAMELARALMVDTTMGTEVRAAMAA